MTASAPHHILPHPVFDKPVKLLIVVARVYPEITDALLAGARAAAGDAEVEVLDVPGVTEIPSAIAMAGRLAAQGYWMGATSGGARPRLL